MAHGRQSWPAKRRLFYAKDTLVLLAVDGPANEAKADRDAAEWLPPRVALPMPLRRKPIAIKTKYELWATQSERMAMSAVLGSC